MFSFFNQSQNREWGKEGKSVVWRFRVGGGAGFIGGISRSQLGGGEGWEKAVHMQSCVTYVRNEHFMFVKRTLTYLTVNIIWWRREQDSGGDAGRGEDRGLGKARVSLSK